MRNEDDVIDNCTYTDGFPIDDSHKKKSESYSRDPSRPFDEGKEEPRKGERITRNNNHTGTTMNEPDKYKK